MSSTEFRECLWESVLRHSVHFFLFLILITHTYLICMMTLSYLYDP